MMTLKSVTANGVRAILKYVGAQVCDFLFNVEVCALHDRHHGDEGRHAHRESEDRENRAQFVCAQRTEAL